MTRKEYLIYVEGIFKAAKGLVQQVTEDRLDFKPQEGLMTVAQIVKHLSDALGGSLAMAISQSWPDIPADQMLPPAEQMPSATSVQESLKEMDNDWQLLLSEIDKLTDEEFTTTKIHVPWIPFPVTYEAYLMQAMEHLSNHRMQLFIWLKLSGLPLNTSHLYGM